MTGADYDHVELLRELHLLARLGPSLLSGFRRAAQTPCNRRQGANPTIEAILPSLGPWAAGVFRITDSLAKPQEDGGEWVLRLMATLPELKAPLPSSRLGWAWILFCLSLAAHVTDEALTGFLPVYNPTVLAMRAKLGFWPMPTFEYREWLTGLILGILLLLALSPFVFRNARWIRPILYLVVIAAGIFNALGHMVATVFGQTVSAVRFPRPAPGFYSSPLLLAASVYVLVQLGKTQGRGAVSPADLGLVTREPTSLY